MLLYLVACDPCSDWAGATVVDADGLVGEAVVARMQRVVDDFYAASGATDACVDTVSVEEIPDEPWLVDRWPTPRVRIDPSVALSEHWLREALCVRLADERGLDGGDDFLDVCKDGPRRFDWADEVIAACGTTALTNTDAFVRDNVWVDDEPRQADGDLAVERGPTVRIEGLAGDDGYIGYAAAVGDRLAVEAWTGEYPDRSVTVSVIDPASGAVVATVPVADTGEMYGGRDAAVHFAYGEGAYTLTAIDRDGGEASVVADGGVAHNTVAVLGNTLYGGPTEWDEVRPMDAVDLATGVVTSIDLPTPPGGLLPLVNGLEAVGDRVLVNLLAAQVDAECGGFDCVVNTAIWDDAYDLYDPATGTWEEAGRDLRFYSAGANADGVAFGELVVPAGSLFAAWDPLSDTFWASDDICAGEVGELGVLAGDTSWRAHTDDDGRTLVLEPLRVSIAR
jgi:hypothetical protein